MSKNVKDLEKVISRDVRAGKLGETTKIVDYIMYLSIIFVMAFGYTSYKKLKEQSDSLIIWL